MADRLFLGPLRGREPGLAERVLGLPRQPDGAADGVEAAAGVDRRARCAATTPTSAWAAGRGRDGLRAVRRGVRRRAALGAGRGRADRRRDDRVDALDELDAWLDDCGPFAPRRPGSRTRSSPGSSRPHASEARGALAVRAAARARSAASADAATTELASGWRSPVARRSAGATVSVMGPRCSFRPVIGPWPTTGAWSFRRRGAHERPQRDRSTWSAARARPSSTAAA